MEIKIDDVVDQLKEIKTAVNGTTERIDKLTVYAEELAARSDLRQHSHHAWGASNAVKLRSCHLIVRLNEIVAFSRDKLYLKGGHVFDISKDDSESLETMVDIRQRPGGDDE